MAAMLFLSKIIAGFKLLKGSDLEHDDSYLLSQLPQKYLRRLVLPLGEFVESAVQIVADSIGIDELNKVSVTVFFCDVTSICDKLERFYHGADKFISFGLPCLK